MVAITGAIYGLRELMPVVSTGVIGRAARLDLLGALDRPPDGARQRDRVQLLPACHFGVATETAAGAQPGPSDISERRSAWATISTMATESTLMSIREAARRLGVHDNTVRRYSDRGLIRAVRLPSGVRRVQREDVEAFAQRTVGRLPADQVVGPVPSLEELVAPGVWRSDKEVEELLALTYAERDRDR